MLRYLHCYDIKNVVVGNITKYVPSNIFPNCDIFVLNYKNFLLQIGGVSNIPHIEYGSPIVFQKEELSKDIKNFRKYLEATPLQSVEYMPEDNIPTFADEYVSFLTYNNAK